MPHELGGETHPNWSTWVLLAATVVLFLVLRCRWLGHLLVWDEAMALCTARSFTAGTEDPFTAWFWRHPPLHTMLLLAVQPFQSGFAERAEALSVFAGAISLTLLFTLNRRVFGNAVGLWSAFFYALLPGCAFFDVWIKQDALVTALGLSALIALVSQRNVICGFFLGLALLTKGTAAFYCLATAILWFSGSGEKRTLKAFLSLAGVAAVTCGWWYLGLAPRYGTMGSSDVFQFAANRQALWENQWFFYLQQMPILLGWFGVFAGGCGIALVIKRLIDRCKTPTQRPAIWWGWPLCLLVPALTVISIVPNKVPWIVITLLPACATLAALALGHGASWLSLHFKLNVPAIRMASIGLALIAIAAINLPAASDYESMLRRIAPGQERGAAKSREIAYLLNEHIRDEDRILLTSFHYWKGMPPGLPDPIFTYYFGRKPSVLLRSHERSASEVVADVRSYQLDWAVLSPEPGDAATVLFGHMEEHLDQPPHKAGGAWLFHTAELHRRGLEARRAPSGQQ
jgi:hypothetical protein